MRENSEFLNNTKTANKLEIVSYHLRVHGKISLQFGQHHRQDIGFVIIDYDVKMRTYQISKNSVLKKEVDLN